MNSSEVRQAAWVKIAPLYYETGTSSLHFSTTYRLRRAEPPGHGDRQPHCRARRAFESHHLQLRPDGQSDRIRLSLQAARPGAVGVDPLPHLIQVLEGFGAGLDLAHSRQDGLAP